MQIMITRLYPDNNLSEFDTFFDTVNKHNKNINIVIDDIDKSILQIKTLIKEAKNQRDYAPDLKAGENAAGNTLCTYSVSDGCVTLSTNETYTNSGTIQAWRKAVNARNKTGTTITNNENATIKISASAAITYGGTIGEAGSSATHTLNNSGTIEAGGQTIQMQNGGNFTITNFSLPVIYK